MTTAPNSVQTDVLERLRHNARGLCSEDPSKYTAGLSVADALEIASIIVAQAKEIERLRSALQPFANAQSIYFACGDDEIQMVLGYDPNGKTGASLAVLDQAKSALTNTQLQREG